MPDAILTAPENDWLSVADAARELRVGRRSLYAAIRRGELRAAFVNGRDIRLCRAWLIQYVSACAERRQVAARG